ncbi:MAG TPA: hypothetical protein VF276_14010 [Chloroflexia bacterium]
MNYTSKLAPRPIPALFTIVLSLAILLGMPSQASAAATYRADDYYLLVKSCTGTSCLRDAAWGPAEAQLRGLFKQQGWGKDPAIASHNPGSLTSWSSWATEHVYYIDGSTAREIRAQLMSTYADLRTAGAIHVLRVEVAR